MGGEGGRGGGGEGGRLDSLGESTLIEGDSLFREILGVKTMARVWAPVPVVVAASNPFHESDNALSIFRSQHGS